MFDEFKLDAASRIKAAEAERRHVLNFRGSAIFSKLSGIYCCLE